MNQLVFKLLKVFRNLLFPMTACRFSPSCLEYTRESVQKFGWIRGFVLGVKRISKCHPWHEGGWDPVPDRKIKAKGN